jgi:hypothetical protein
MINLHCRDFFVFRPTADLYFCPFAKVLANLLLIFGQKSEGRSLVATYEIGSNVAKAEVLNLSTKPFWVLMSLQI